MFDSYFGNIIFLTCICAHVQLCRPVIFSPTFNQFLNVTFLNTLLEFLTLTYYYLVAKDPWEITVITYFLNNIRNHTLIIIKRKLKWILGLSNEVMTLMSSRIMMWKKAQKLKNFFIHPLLVDVVFHDFKIWHCCIVGSLPTIWMPWGDCCWHLAW